MRPGTMLRNGRNLLGQIRAQLIRSVSSNRDHVTPDLFSRSSSSYQSCRLLPWATWTNQWQPSRWTHLSSTWHSKVVPFNLPDVGEAIMTVVVKEWLVQPGDTVAMGDPICEVQSDKSAATIYCPFDGIIKQLMYEVDDIAKKDEPLVMILVDSNGELEQQGEREEDNKDTKFSEPSVAMPTEGSQSSDTPASGSGKVLATPAVRRIANEHNIDLSLIKGTGEKNRILKEDILNYIESKTIKEPVGAPVAPPPATPTDWVEPIKGFKMIMVQTMTTSGRIPQFGYCDEVLMSEAIQLRAELSEFVKDKGVKFTFMPLLIKALSMALKEYPILNAHVGQSCSEITYRADHNIGVAVDTSQGLVVPNIKRVQNLSVIDIAMELHRVQELSISGSLAPSDVTGGTFSVSNIGALGGTYTRPLILPPEVCIGAFGKIQEVPRFDENGDIIKSHVMYVSWSADHRVIEGAVVARFSNLWRKYLENPTSLLAQMV